MELHNSSSSRSSNFGINTGATIGYGYGTQITGNGGSVSASRSNLNTTETVYQNGNFANVNEVHNNTGTMTLSGFNQEGGRVTGNIDKLVVESRQNTSTTIGSSSGIGIGISANGMPNSVNVNGSRTNGSRAFVDNQSSFIVGEGSNLHVGTVENTGAIIGKQSENGTTFKVDKYVGHDIQNYDTMTTTGISVGTSLGKSPRVTNIGFKETGDKQGITRNTVVGNVEIGEASGSPINRDVTKANEVTKDVQHSTNINVESQTIEYATNPTKFKEDLEVAILEGKATGETILKSIENAVNGRKSSDIGDPERRTINEIKESVIRIKTAPEMNLIATGDLNSEKILKELDISAVEKYDPDNPNLPPKVRARVDKLAQKGEVPGIFYDKITNKIFVDENITDEAVIRAGIAREWKISEDLKTGKGKENDEGQLKATVAGELAYDDMMKRAGEGKTGSISTSELDEAVMDTNSEVTSDKALEVKPEDLRAWGSAISQIDGPYPYADMISGVLNGVAWFMENNSRIKSSTKNERKVNDKAYKQAKKDYEKAKSEYEELESRPNKTLKDKQERDKAKNKMEKALERMRKSENHSRRVQGQKSKGGGNKK